MYFPRNHCIKYNHFKRGINKDIKDKINSIQIFNKNSINNNFIHSNFLLIFLINNNSNIYNNSLMDISSCNNLLNQFM